jgi:hypothetical protein
LLAAKPEALSAVARIFIQELQRWQRQRAQALEVEQHRAPTRLDLEESVTALRDSASAVSNSRIEFHKRESDAKASR